MIFFDKILFFHQISRKNGQTWCLFRDCENVKILNIYRFNHKVYLTQVIGIIFMKMFGKDHINMNKIGWENCSLPNLEKLGLWLGI